MWEAITSIIGAVFSGGATGLIGIGIQRFAEFKKQQLELEVVKLNHQNALALADKETERARLRAEADQAIADRGATAREREAEEDAHARQIEADSRSLLASYEHDRASYIEKGAMLGKGKSAAFLRVAMGIVDFARGMLRPGLTIHLTVIVTMMFLTMVAILEKAGGLNVEDVKPILTLIVQTITYCWTTCVVWWFGTRQSQQAK
jgi:hypothetical protein